MPNYHIAVDPGIFRKMPNSNALEWKEDYLDLLMAISPEAEFKPQSVMGGYIKNVYGIAWFNRMHTIKGGYLIADVDFERFLAISEYCKRFSYYTGVYVMTDVHWWHFPHKDVGSDRVSDVSYHHVLYAADPPPKWENVQPSFKPDGEYLVAMSGNYGIERPKGLDKSIQTYKVGYIRGMTALTMIGGIKKDHTPKRASYFYVELNDNVKPVGGYFTMMMTGDKVNEIATFPASDDDTLFVFTDGQWWAFPYSQRGAAIGFTKLPDYNAKRINDALGKNVPSDTKQTIAAGRVTILKDQRGDSTPWWWVSGEETRNHIELLKAHGGRWSKKRKAWYFIANELHTDVLALGGVTEESSEDTATDEVLL